MNNPTSEQFKKVINNFIKILPQARFKGHLDMEEADVEINVCGTPMCHGGWYAVASKVGIRPDFADGANAMAVDLGFSYRGNLKCWADQNPKLWGNKFGYRLFSGNSAFNYAKTMRGVINHWIGVHNRTCPKSKPINKIK